MEQRAEDTEVSDRFPTRTSASRRSLGEVLPEDSTRLEGLRGYFGRSLPADRPRPESGQSVMEDPDVSTTDRTKITDRDRNPGIFLSVLSVRSVVKSPDVSTTDCTNSTDQVRSPDILLSVVGDPDTSTADRTKITDRDRNPGVLSWRSVGVALPEDHAGLKEPRHHVGRRPPADHPGTLYLVPSSGVKLDHPAPRNRPGSRVPGLTCLLSGEGRGKLPVSPPLAVRHLRSSTQRSGSRRLRDP